MSDLESNSDLNPELCVYRDQVQDIKRATEELIRDLTAAQLQWKPNPEVWSIVQCLDHLVATARTELPCVRHAIAEGRSRGLLGHGPFRYGRIAELLILVMGRPARLKFKSPKSYLPGDGTNPAVVIRNFFQVHDEILACIRAANGLHLSRTKVSISDYRYLRLSLGQELKLFVVHEQRHILQAERIKAEAVRGVQQ